jgi:plastocyanin
MKRLMYSIAISALVLLIFVPTVGAQQEGQDATAPTGGNVWSVSIQDFFFAPADALVGAGDQITFVNEGNEPHTVTADDGQFDSGVLNPGDSFTVTFEGSGTITYHCEIHPSMVGSVTVGGDSGGETTSEPPQTTGGTVYVPGGTVTHYETMG